jgi:hypothetical protein
MKRVYVAGAYRGPNIETILDNVRNGCEWVSVLNSLGFFTYNPWADLLEAIHTKLPVEFWMSRSLSFLSVCEALFLTPGWETSVGTMKELVLAFKLGIPVFDTIEDLLAWADGGSTYKTVGAEVIA